MAVVSPSAAIIAALGLSQRTAELTVEQLQDQLTEAAEARKTIYADQTASGGQKAASTRRVKMIIDTLGEKGVTVNRDEYLPEVAPVVTEMTDEELYTRLRSVVDERTRIHADAASSGAVKAQATKNVTKVASELMSRGVSTEDLTTFLQSDTKPKATRNAKKEG